MRVTSREYKVILDSSLFADLIGWRMKPSQGDRPQTE